MLPNIASIDVRRRETLNTLYFAWLVFLISCHCCNFRNTHMVSGLRPCRFSKKTSPKVILISPRGGYIRGTLNREMDLEEPSAPVDRHGVSQGRTEDAVLQN